MQAKKQEEISDIKRFTGMCPFQIIAVNPTLEDLKSLGVTYIKEEPKYVTEKDGVVGLRLDFWIKNSVGETYQDTDGTMKNSGPIIDKIAYFIDNNDAKAKTGKFRAVNDLLQNSYTESLQALIDNPNMSWVSKGHNLRLAKNGEIEVLTLFQKLLNLSTGYKEKQGDEVKFTTPWSKIVSGDLKELRGYIKTAYEYGNGLTFLRGVNNKEGKLYNATYTKYFQSSKNKKTTYMEKALVDQDFTADYQNSLKFQLYTGTAIPVPSSPSAELASADQDLPF
jgi:hypothetical protein